MKEKILVAEDEKSIADPIAFALKKEDYFVSVVYDGEAAISEYMDFQPDVIILDIMMPKLDGYEVLKRLDYREKAGIILLTAKGKYELSHKRHAGGRYKWT